MRNKQLLIVAVMFLTGCQAKLSGTALNELDERQKVRSAAVQAFSSSNYEELDQVADRYRKNGTRFGSGVWKLTFFYLGLSDHASWHRKEPDVWIELKSKGNEWVKNSPDSPTAYIAHGIILENYAWSIRGPGTANTVDPASWAPFREGLLEAKQFLVANRAIAERDPHWYVSMVRLATALQEPRENVLRLVEEATERKPLYYQTYFAAVDYFTPKWGASIETLREFVSFVVDRTRSEEGLSLYTRVYWAALQSWWARDVWQDLDWERFRAGMYDVLERYPDQWNINNFAKFACMARDISTAREIISKVRESPIEAVWGQVENYESCRSWAISQ